MYKRILLKLSGESLQGTDGRSICEQRLVEYADQIIEASRLGVQIGIVIGGGNIFRGLRGIERGFDRVGGDQMGMLATVINSLALQSAIESGGTLPCAYSDTDGADSRVLLQTQGDRVTRTRRDSDILCRYG